MASQQVVVRIQEGASVVAELVRRPVRLTPDGYAGIVYNGAVYPLFVHDVVDISGASWEVEDCSRFLFAGASIPYAPRFDDVGEQQTFLGFHDEWEVETNRFGHYLVFNAPERLATDVVDALEAGGLSVQRWDVSHRPTTEGKFYDWFARLRFKGSHEEVVAQISAIFSAASAEPAVAPAQAPSVTPLEDLAAQVEQFVDLTAELRERLSTSESEVSLLRQRLNTASCRETKLSDDLDRALDHQKTLQDQLAGLSRDPRQAAETKIVLKRQAETEELLELAFAENSELRSSLANYRYQAEQGDVRILTLEATVVGLQERLQEFGEQERERRRANVTARAPRRGVPGFLEVAFSRLIFVLDSVEVLANLDSSASMMRSLVQIDMGEVVGKDLEGLRGWREVTKLATGVAGSEDMGRIYYKPDGDRVLVSVHVKQDDKEQRRHIERLRSI